MVKHRLWHQAADSRRNGRGGRFAGWEFILERPGDAQRTELYVADHLRDGSSAHPAEAQELRRAGLRVRGQMSPCCRRCSLS